MSQILYTRLSPRHNWDLLATQAENTGNFIRSWSGHLSGVVKSEKWLEKYPKAQIGLALSDFEGGHLEDKYDNLRPNSPMLEVWNVSDLVSKITSK